MKCLLASGLLLLTQTVAAQSAMVVEFRWHISHHCSSTSPVIKVKNIPAGTLVLEVQMQDLDSQNPAHGGGGGKVTNEGGFPAEFKIPSGALSQYKGPCPDNFTTLGHEYLIEVSAIGADAKRLSQGSAKAPFSGKFVILQGVIGNPAD
jgi:phosphatidylethanolamine-binding protein (PEBP) family uncharacterized protein